MNTIKNSISLIPNNCSNFQNFPIMFTKKLVIATLIATILTFALSYLWYEILMSDFFTTTNAANREHVLFPMIILGTIIYSFAFCRLYSLCFNSEKPVVSQALQYGTLIGLLAVVANALFRHATVKNIAANEIFVDAIFNFVLTIVVALVVALYFGTEPPRGGGMGSGGED